MGYREILAALADETRRGILQELRRVQRSAGELAEALGVSPQALSYHLAKLKKSELVRETRRGNFIYYEPDLTVLDEALVWLTELRRGESDEAVKANN